MSQSTGIRINRSTIDELRIAGQEIGTVKRIILTSDDERVSALIDHWNATKELTGTPAVQGSQAPDHSVPPSD